jgi:hypothetical protein
VDTWGDSDSESEAGTGAELNTPDPVRAEWFEIRDSEHVYPLVNPIVHQHHLDGNIMRFPWFNDIPDKRFFAMIGIAHYSSLIDRHPRVSRWGANQGCPIKEGQHITITPNLETQRPSMSIFVRRDDGSTVECKIHGSECVVFAVDGPGKLSDWWFEAGSQQHAQRSNDKLLQSRWTLKAGARVDFEGITKAELDGMNGEWLIAHPSDAFFVELLGDPIMSATITLRDEDPQALRRVLRSDDEYCFSLRQSLISACSTHGPTDERSQLLAGGSGCSTAWSKCQGMGGRPFGRWIAHRASRACQLGHYQTIDKVKDRGTWSIPGGCSR